MRDNTAIKMKAKKANFARLRKPWTFSEISLNRTVFVYKLPIVIDISGCETILFFVIKLIGILIV